MSAVEMTANIQRLQDFRTRYSYSDSCLAAANYIRDRFVALGPGLMDPFTFNGYQPLQRGRREAGRAAENRLRARLIATADRRAGADDSGRHRGGAERRGSWPLPEATTATSPGAGSRLTGSKHYVRRHVMPQNDDVRGVFNLDMIAYVHPQYPEWDANWYGDNPVSGALAQHVGQCVQDYTTCVLHLAIEANPRSGSDQYWFAVHGYPAVFDIDARMWSAPDWNPNYHSANDRLSTLDVPYATEMARGAVAALAELAVPGAGTAILAPAPALAGWSLAVGPNPFGAAVAFDVGAETAAVRVMDAAGRVVSELAGSGRLVWRGRDAGGRALPAGVYFYTVAGGGQERAGGDAVDAGGRSTSSPAMAIEPVTDIPSTSAGTAPARGSRLAAVGRLTSPRRDGTPSLLMDEWAGAGRPHQLRDPRRHGVHRARQPVRRRLRPPAPDASSFGRIRSSPAIRGGWAIADLEVASRSTPHRLRPTPTGTRCCPGARRRLRAAMPRLPVMIHTGTSFPGAHQVRRSDGDRRRGSRYRSPIIAHGAARHG
jgi:hypothetical protein